jgi:hypothetical protein
MQDDLRSWQSNMQRTDAKVDRVQANSESTVLFGSADKVMGNCLKEKAQTLA